MKKLLLLLCFVFSYSQWAAAQPEWAPVGTKWWVAFETEFGEYFTKYECTGTVDTLGHTCKLIHESSFDGTENDHFSYQDGNQVYFYDGWTGEFTLYFDYSKQAGEHYEIITPVNQDTVTFYVDSVANKVFDGDAFKVQYGHIIDPNIPFSYEDNKVYEGVGTYHGLVYNLPVPFTSEIWYYLVCYLNHEGKLYNMSPGLNVDCLELSTATVFQSEKRTGFTVYPNPTAGSATVDLTMPINPDASIQLYNSYGQLLQIHRLQNAENSLLLDGLAPGLYMVVLESEGKRIKTERLLRI